MSDSCSKKCSCSSEKEAEKCQSSESRDADFGALDRDDGAKNESATDSSTKNNAAEKKCADLESRIGALKAELNEANEKYLRALAELENFKKRSLKERSELLKYQGEQILVDMLAIADNLDRAVQHLDADPAQIKTGVQLIHKLFVDVLAKWNVKPLEAQGQEFDPSKFAALSKVQLQGTKPGTIVSEVKKAYMYKDKLLRAGEVVVAVEPDVKNSEEGPAKE